MDRNILAIPKKGDFIETIYIFPALSVKNFITCPSSTANHYHSNDQSSLLRHHVVRVSLSLLSKWSARRQPKQWLYFRTWISRYSGLRALNFVQRDKLCCCASPMENSFAGLGPMNSYLRGCCTFKTSTRNTRPDFHQNGAGSISKLGSYFDSLLCTERFFPGYCGFPLTLKARLYRKQTILQNKWMN